MRARPAEGGGEVEVLGLLLYLAIVASVGFLIARWGAISAIEHVLKNEPELVGRVMLRLLKTSRFREELKSLIIEAVEGGAGGE